MNLKTHPVNLIIDDSSSAQDLIETAGLVISFNSTTGIEAVLKKKCVVLPHYEEAAGELKDHLLITETLDSFHVAYSQADLEFFLTEFKLERPALKSPNIEAITMLLFFI